MSKLLVIDDDPDLAELLTSVLEDAGHEVRIAEHGQAGLDRIGESRPDAVLLDVDMPILDGPTMAYRLFLRDRGDETIPIVLLSGVPDLWRVAERVGTPYFLEKPYRIANVSALVQRALTERRAPVPRPEAT
jgi:CheY-like chemotaxis protein